MNKRMPASFPLRRLLEEGMATLRERESARHRRDPGDPCFYASELSNCDRQIMLRVLNMPSDPPTLESWIAMATGSAFHGVAQEALEAVVASTGWTLVGIECGGRSPLIPLKARADCLFIDRDGLLHLAELKSEGMGAPKRRREAARAAGMTSTARPEHALQAAATVEVIETLLEPWGVTFAEAWVIYYSTADRDLDVPQPIGLDTQMRRRVYDRVGHLEGLYRRTVESGTLPPRVPIEGTKKDGSPMYSWQCRPDPHRGEPFGMYCEVRRACLGTSPKEEW